MELVMTSQERKPWNTPDFELRFREAMGRQMTAAEREFFGLDPDTPNGHNNSDAPPSNNAKFAWQALRRISALLGTEE